MKTLKLEGLVAATCPSYFKSKGVAMLVERMAELAVAAPELLFYYYHIPSLTSSTLDMVAFLSRGGDRIANLVGLKYTEMIRTLGRWHDVGGCRLPLGCISDADSGALQAELAAIGFHDWSQLPTIASDS